jgi:hydroxyethylthiazole kinase-like sugar kinase family protein
MPAVISWVVDTVSSAVEVGVMASTAIVSQEVYVVISGPVDTVPDFSKTMYIKDDKEQVTLS